MKTALPSALLTLERMTQALRACEQGQLSPSALIAQWRANASALPLPARYLDVLNGLLDRLESSALFSGESCSFSQQGLFDNLQVWADKAGAECRKA